MGIDPKTLPDSFRRCVAQPERKKVGLGDTFEEASAKGAVKMEINDLHKPFEQWLRLHKFSFIHANPRKKSTIRSGWPDFTVIHRYRAVLIEFKAPGGRLSEDQKACIEEIECNGTTVQVCETVKDAIFTVKEGLQC